MGSDLNVKHPGRATDVSFFCLLHVKGGTSARGCISVISQMVDPLEGQHLWRRWG